MAAKLSWDGDAFKQHVKSASAESLRAATVFYWSACQRAVSITNPLNNETGEYDSPSEPGEAPRLRTGFGKKNIVWEFDDEKVEGRVGVRANALYMFFLEIGTQHIARRPWLLVTLMANQETIGLLASTPSQGRVTGEGGGGENAS